MLRLSLAAALLLVGGARAQGSVAAVYSLLERVIPSSSSHFALSIADSCPGVANGVPCFTLSDSGSQLSVSATSASELTAGIGYYLREICNMTIGWPRGGGSNLYMPTQWPVVGNQPVIRSRIAKYSYIENVCTHS